MVKREVGVGERVLNEGMAEIGRLTVGKRGNQDWS
jgi:hypothetical protein